MAGVDKFGAAFAVGFMVLMLAFMGGLTPDGELPGISVPETPTPTPTPTYSPPVESTPPETVTTQSERESLTGFLQYTIRGGGVDSITNNPSANSVTVLLDNNVDGQLTITMTKDAITPFDDGSYFVTIDGEENHDFIQSGQKLTIEFLAGSEEIMIFGISDNLVVEAEAEHAAMMAAEKAAADAAKAPMSAEVVPVAGSASPGCEPECYDPSTVTISAGGTVTFVNTDTAPHTVTSGTATDGPDGVWDSSLIMIDMSYSVTLDNSGTYDYFCMVHPWMQGIVIVE